MNLLYLTFGDNLSNHIQAHFSIYSFLTQESDISTINVITDHPDFYKSLKDFIKVMPVDKETLKKWKGKYDFFWRIKIKAIELMCDQYKNEPVIYLDSDTFLYQNVQHLKSAILQGSAFMHENEGPLSSARSKTEKKMWRQVKNKKYPGVEINSSYTMWNAGAVITPNTKNNKENELALQICDEMCQQDVTRRLVEQFALSISLNNTYGLQPANNSIAHYWSNKEEWNNIILQFFTSCNFKCYSQAQVIKAMKDFNFSAAPVKRKVRNTNTRLKKVVEKAFPAKNIKYIENEF